MIAEAIDTALTLGWALAAWIAVLSAGVTLVMLGVAGAVWWACAWLYARLRAEVPAKAHRLPRTRERPAQRRLWLRAARDARPAPTTTAPSRPRMRCCDAPQARREGFPAPTRQRASQGRTAPRARPAPSWAHTNHHRTDHAA